ncbi:MAG: tRNA (N(6)-L-threonylcarbamoyladenosine(37)-C(2))-methylthiotransferase MtaB [Acidobacteriota bacterium]
MRFSVYNFGCRANTSEAFQWVESLTENGYKFEKNFEDSDIVIINSCTLTSRADRDVKNLIKKINQKDKKARVVLTGCYLQRKPEELERLGEIFLKVLNEEKDSIPQKIIDTFGKKQNGSKVVSYRSRALVKIQDGCNLKCSFCIIPLVRGKSRSIPSEEIIEKIKKYSDEGYKEIVLTGIHINSWGIDFSPKRKLSDLIREINKINSVNYMRLTSLDPRFLNEEMIETLISSEKIAPHFHLSIQSGSEKILKLMRRDSIAKRYEDIIYKLKESLPESCVGADIIVGFPGEIDEDFRRTYEFVKNVPLDYLHVFPFSPRPGTEASKMNNKVDEKVKTRRASLLRKLSREKKEKFIRNFMGKELEGVVIRNNFDSGEVLTSNYIKAKVINLKNREKELTKIRIGKVQDGIVWAESI